MANSFSATGGTQHSSFINVAIGSRYNFFVRCADASGNFNIDDLNIEFAVKESVNAPIGSNGEKIAHPLGLKEGELIRGPDGIKVYIINDYGYKRHIFNPAVFNMYGHFSWNSIKDVEAWVYDTYKISDIYRALNDPKVYSLDEVSEVSGIAIKRHLDMTAEKFISEGYDWNQVFVVNDTERDFYQTGTAQVKRSLTFSDVVVSSITSNSAKLTWKTDRASDSGIDWGVTANYGDTFILGGSSIDGSLRTSHSVEFKNLNSSTLYHFRVTGKDSSGFISQSIDYTFITIP